jgi:putative DNA primase/helicase
MLQYHQSEQDKQLHIKIIENELSGVFNWVLEGLNRLFQKNFQIVKQQKKQLNNTGLKATAYRCF